MRGLVDNAAVGVRIDRQIIKSFERTGVDIIGIANKLRPYVLGDTADATWFIGDDSVRTDQVPEYEAYDVTSLLEEKAYDLVYRGELPPTDRTKPIVVLPHSGGAIQLTFSDSGDEVLSITPLEVDCCVTMADVPLVIEPDATYRNEMLYRFQYLV